MTHELETFLKTELAPSKPLVGHAKTLYRLYTEAKGDIRPLIKRYFNGATLTYGVGMDARTQLADESSVTIEIVSSLPDSLERILNLAKDIRVENNQISVLVTQQPVTTFEVTA